MNEAWWSGWIPIRAFVTLVVVYELGSFVYLRSVNRDVLRHRKLPKKGTETWDMVWFVVFNSTLVAIFVVAWLDVESQSPSLPLRLWPIGLILFVVGGGLFTRAMGENPFFEKTVRIQSERGHHVIDTGPYRTVRHPGYVGLIAWVLSFPLLLTSPWALLPTAIAVISLVIRTVLEDRTLRRKLPGYADYAARVQSRLIPGVW